MKPSSLTKPAKYAAWRSFYDDTFAPVNKAVMAQGFRAFAGACDQAIKACNACHEGMGYKFIEVVRLKRPANPGMNCNMPSKATDMPR